ncbi:MAG: gliding motility-associated ABC transporter substrate-binding protein GldG [Bacteroidales bacterium]|nr:gliding motility-associated ABC transporter substrate-binding protein GldG [Bacteroidales bacterium]
MKKNLRKENIIHLIIVLVIILLVNYISSNAYFRLDLTSDKRYTLSDASVSILDSLDDYVYIEIYLDGDMPIGFQRMKKSTKELMEEFRVVAGKNIQYQFVNPAKSNNQSERNAIFQDLFDRGLKPTNVKDRDEEGGLAEKILFPGAIITYKENETPVNLLVNNPGFSADVNLNKSIQTLEYEFINAIRKITTSKRKKVAFIEGQGELDEYNTGDITRALNEFYDIDRVTIKDYVNILDPYDVVIIAGPAEPYTEKSKFILDQYIMNGGKVLWFVESVRVSMDSLSTGSSTFVFYNDVNLNDQLFRYGVRVNPNVIQDINCAVIPVNTAIAGTQAKFTPAPWLYFPLLVAPDNNPVTRNLNMIKSEFPALIDTVGNNEEIKKQSLLFSSVNSRVLNVPLLVNLEQLKEQVDPSTFNQPFNSVAVSLKGNFESVFKNRSVNSFISDTEFEFKEKSISTRMIVVSDVDIIRNDVRHRPDGVFISPLGFDRYTQQTYGNKDFVMNAVHYLVDESGILNIRSREIKLRILDKARVKDERVKWQLINTVFPVLLVILFGVLLTFLRKRKYA